MFTSLADHWRLVLALVFFACAFVGFQSGVVVSERDLSDADALTNMYYSLGLFILGGMDLGVPVAGPWWGLTLLWLSYFGSPVLTASALVDWVQQVISHQDRWLRSLDDHIIVVGTNDLAVSLLRKVLSYNPGSQVLIVDKEINSVTMQEFRSVFQAQVLEGDVTNDFFLSTIRVKKARQVVLAAESDFENYESASRILEQNPDLGPRILVHCNRLRFLREVEHSHVANACHTFNSYNLAARHLVRSQMMAHFHATELLDKVVLAGFGRFGQTILEELQETARGEISEIGIIDVDAHRRILVAEEQAQIDSDVNIQIVEGDIGHPAVWQKMESMIDLNTASPLVLIGTGNDQENLRTGLWLRKHHPNVMVMVRSAQASHFASSLAEQSGIQTFGVSEVIYDSLPNHWFE